MKNFDAATIAAIKNQNPMVSLIDMALSYGNYSFTTCAHNLDYASTEYIAGGIVLSTGSIEENNDLTVQQISIQFSAADPTMLALFSNANQQNRRVQIRVAVLDDVHQVIGVISSKSFIVDSFTDDNDGNGQATISVSLSNWLSNFESVNGLRTTQNSFRRLYPNSKAFINSKDLKEDLEWGGE